MGHTARKLPRPRLRDALLHAGCRLRLLWAPAGSGKTVLLDECLACAAADTRLVRLDLRGQVLSPRALQARLGNALGLADAHLAALLEALANMAQPLWLVLDDYPRFPDAGLDHLLNELLQESSPRVRWWITSRRRPRLQLTRLLLEGELFELGAGELAFTLEELSALSDLNGFDPAVWAPAQLLALSGGWCAGVALSLLGPYVGQPLQISVYRSLMLDYLRREVLDELPAGWQLGLFTLAQFPQFDREFCEQVLGAGEGERLLESLLECGLFIEPLAADGQLLRIQPALAGVLAGQLPETMAKALFRKACQWYIARANVRPALEYALKAGQPELAASLMQQFTLERLLQGQGFALLLEWRRELPEELLVGTPALALLNAWASLLTGRIDEGLGYMAALNRYLPQGNAERQRALLAQCKALQGEAAFLQGHAGGAALLTEAIAELPAQAWSQRLLCYLSLTGRSLVAGDFDAARGFIRTAMQQAREQASLAFETLFVLEHAKLLEMRGELLRAEGLLSRLQAELAGAWSGEFSPVRGRVLLRQAGLLMLRGRYQEARLAFESAIGECRAGADPAAVLGYLGLADLQALQGALDEAWVSIGDAERLMHCERISAQRYNDQVLACRARIWLVQGRHAQAGHALRHLLDSPRMVRPAIGIVDLYRRLRMLLAQAMLPSAERQVAVAELASMHAEALAGGGLTLACELGFILAEGLHAEGRHAQARQVLLDSLGLARQLGLASVERAFAQRNPSMLRWAFETEADSGSAILLSPRELEVLELIARGLSNQQIGDALFISLYTVKTHAQRINFKLGVKRRTQAVARAKALGLV